MNPVVDDTLDDPMEIELLAQMAREQSYYRTALRSAKAGLFRNVVAANAAYPLIDVPGAVRQSGRPEEALVLAIIRQESGFDHNARPPRGSARGGSRTCRFRYTPSPSPSNPLRSPTCPASTSPPRSTT